MAKVRNNIFVRGLNGDLGNQFYVSTNKETGRTTVSARDNFENTREPSEAQKAHQLAFRDAIFYAQSMKDEEIYRIKADVTGKRPFNLAVADWFHAPEILSVDASAWNGAAGRLVRVRAKDDVRVERVILRFSDATGELLEEGAATELGSLWWDYTTTTPMTGVVTVTVTAVDLPGNMTEESLEKSLS